MSDYFAEVLLPPLIAREGGDKFTNNPNDAGGPTKFGITAKALGISRALGRDATAAEVEALELEEASEIYRDRYWTGVGLDLLCAVSRQVAADLFDAVVNMGPHTPITWIQRVLNALNQGATLWPDLAVDGSLGPGTVGAFRALAAKRGMQPAQSALHTGIHCFRFVRYVELGEKGTGRTENEEFEWGWLSQRVGWGSWAGDAA